MTTTTSNTETMTEELRDILVEALRLIAVIGRDLRDCVHSPEAARIVGEAGTLRRRLLREPEPTPPPPPRDPLQHAIAYYDAEARRVQAERDRHAEDRRRGAELRERGES